jgi:hypothetical protein
LIRPTRETPRRRAASDWFPLALIALAFTILAFFGGELLDPLGIPGIWFSFGIGVSRTQYLFAIFIPLLAFLMVRTWGHPRPPRAS